MTLGLRRLTFKAVPLACVAVLCAALVTPASAYRRPGIMQLASVATDGTQALYPPTGGGVFDVDISANGRFVAFDSSAANLVPGDVNLSPDIFVRDQRKPLTERVSISSQGVQGLGACGLDVLEPTNGFGAQSPAVSANGRFVAFESCFINLVSGDANGVRDIFVHDRSKKETVRVSVSSKGVEANDYSTEPAISANGRFIAFRSHADSLVPNDKNEMPDVFVHDLKRHRTVLVSQDSAGKQAEGDPAAVFIQGSNCPSLNASGRYVAFQSTAPLVQGDTNLSTDLFVRDLARKKTTRVSIASDGREARGNEHYTKFMSGTCYSGDEGRRALSASGRYVAFYSTATSLVPNDGNGGQADIFVHDRKSGRTERVSVNPAGIPGNSWSSLSSISADGRFVAFASYSDFFSGDTGHYFGPALALVQPGDADIFIHDRQTGSLEWVSTAPDGGESLRCSGLPYPLQPPPLPGQEDGNSSRFSSQPTLGSNGRLVAFKSCADNLVTDDKNGAWDAFVRDRGDPLGLNRSVTGGSDVVVPGNDSFRITKALDRRDEIGDVGTGAADIIEARLVHRPAYADLFGVVELRRMSSISGVAHIEEPLLYTMAMTVDGVRYEIRAAGGPALGRGAGRFALFRCDSQVLCRKVADLEGGFGTTGHRIVWSVPLELFGASGTVELNRVQVSSDTGSVETGGLLRRDQVRID